MKMQIVHHPLWWVYRKGIIIFWQDRRNHKKSHFFDFYWNVCWWLYDHTNLFNEIPDGERFSWKYLYQDYCGTSRGGLRLIRRWMV